MKTQIKSNAFECVKVVASHSFRNPFLLFTTLFSAVLDRFWKWYSLQGKIRYESLFAKRDYVRCYTVYQIWSEDFGVVEGVTKIEVVKKPMGQRNSQKCITYVKVSGMHSRRKL